MPSPPASALTYPHGDAVPEPGTARELTPHLRWVRMRLPFALDHINLWLLRDRDDAGRDGWAIVDCGIADAATQAAWTQVFDTGLDGLPVLRVIVTHMHPDHIGNAHWLTQRFDRPGRDCRLWISATDWNAARMASLSTTGFGGDNAARFFASHGLVDPDALAKVRARGDYYSRLVPQVPHRYRRLMDGQVLTIGAHTWHAIAGYGHAPEHMALHCPEQGVLISGDMLLPKISTNVSVIDLEPEADPLPLFLRSVERLTALPPETLVLPSHGLPFHGLHARVAQLHAHHAARLQEVQQACAERACTAADLLTLLFHRPLDLHQTTFAMGEAIAHLHALWQQGSLRREVDESGTIRFRAASTG